MANSEVNQSVARPVRTGVQGGVGWAVTEFVDAFFWNMDDRQYGIAVVILTMLVGFIQINFEDYLGKAFLRKIPEQPAPALDDNPAV